jgi:AcrR family transcriptional regulator
VSGEVKRRVPGSERRRLILEQARATFLESGEGINGASVRLIAERCGINEALVYRHFGSKENLYFEAVSLQVGAAIEAMLERVRDSVVGEASPARERREWELTHATVLEMLTLPPETLRAVGALLFGERSYAEAFYEHSLGPAVGVVEDVVEAEKANWSHQPFSGPLAVRVMFGTAFWHVMEAGLAGRPPDAEAVARELTDMIFYGIARPRP